MFTGKTNKQNGGLPEAKPNTFEKNQPDSATKMVVSSQDVHHPQRVFVNIINLGTFGNPGKNGILGNLGNPVSLGNFGKVSKKRSLGVFGYLG